MRTFHRPGAVLGLAAAIIAPGCVAISGADLKYVERDEKRFTTTGNPQVSLSTFDGSIEIRPWDRHEVLVVVEKRGMSKDDVAPIAVRAEQDGDRVTFAVTNAKDRNVGWFGFNRSAKLIVSIPAASDLSAKSGDGSIDVEGVSGKIELRSGDGSIRGRSLDGDVVVQTGDGSIRLDGRFTGLSARSGDGSVRVHAGEGSAPAADWEINTGDGSVALEIPDGFNGDVDAHTGDGRVHAEGLGLSREGRNTVRGRLGAGGKSIRIRTGDGSITLSRP